MASALLHPGRSASHYGHRHLTWDDGALTGLEDRRAGAKTSADDRTWFFRTVARDVELRMTLLATAGMYWQPTSQLRQVPAHTEKLRDAAEGVDWWAVSDDTYRVMALRTLARIQAIGTAEEQAATGSLLLEALRESRAREGRPF